MIHLNRNQYAFLLRLSKTTEMLYEDLNEDEKKMIFFLEEKGFAKVNWDTAPYPNPTERKIVMKITTVESVSITEGGKAYISERRTSIVNKWLPYIITTIISILALMKSYGLGIDDIITWCIRLSKR